jgi:phosphoesterase RecJ-like protein
MIQQGKDITSPLEVDVAIAVDCANKERLGAACLQAISQAKTLVNLDHHRSNEGYGDHHHIDWISPATGQILWDFFQQTGLPLTKAVAENLYVAISTDTGSFQYENVTARTYEIGAEIMRMGVNIAELNRQTYESFPRRRIELLRGLLNEMEITHEGRVASWALRQELAVSVGMKPEDAEGLIDTIRAIDGVIVAMHLEELGDSKIRISLRSKDPKVDVGAVAAKFGGGGHTLAAGARFRGTVEEAKEQLFHAIKQAL